MNLIEPDELKQFQKVLAQFHLTAGEFTLRETDTTDPKTDEIYALTGFVKITRNSNGKQGEYPTGDDSRWVEEFERDLAEKKFD
jgi:hypothetical protein